MIKKCNFRLPSMKRYSNTILTIRKPWNLYLKKWKITQKVFIYEFFHCFDKQSRFFRETWTSNLFILKLKKFLKIPLSCKSDSVIFSLRLETHLKLRLKSLTVPYSPLQSLAVPYSPLQSLTVPCSSLQSLAVPYSPLQSITVPYSPI